MAQESTYTGAAVDFVGLGLFCGAGTPVSAVAEHAPKRAKAGEVEACHGCYFLESRQGILLCWCWCFEDSEAGLCLQL
jgi:hypothetical protein